jgi:hypothetical protein
MELALDSRGRYGTSGVFDQTGRVLHQSRLPRTCPSKVAIRAPKPFRDGQHRRWISLLELPMKETGRFL